MYICILYIYVHISFLCHFSLIFLSVSHHSYRRCCSLHTPTFMGPNRGPTSYLLMAIAAIHTSHPDIREKKKSHLSFLKQWKKHHRFPSSKAIKELVPKPPTSIQRKGRFKDLFWIPSLNEKENRESVGGLETSMTKKCLELGFCRLPKHRIIFEYIMIINHYNLIRV